MPNNRPSRLRWFPPGQHLGYGGGQLFRQELKRLAEELDGEYIACMDIYGNRLKAELEKSDGVHPNAAGNRLLAEQLLKAASPLYK